MGNGCSLFKLNKVCIDGDMNISAEKDDLKSQNEEVKNLEDYAGWKEHSIIGLAMKVDKGSMKYRVTTVSGKTLGWITQYDINDYINGWAGNGEPIATVEVYYYTPDSIRPYKKAKYKVNDYDWQYDLETSNGQDGYAGEKGVVAKKFQIEIV